MSVSKFTNSLDYKKKESAPNSILDQILFQWFAGNLPHSEMSPLIIVDLLNI